jgi:hypothetical protein
VDPTVAPALAPTSPFLGGGYLSEIPSYAAPYEETQPGLRSPFAEALLETGGSEEEQLLDRLLGEVDDETFEDAVEALVDEVAGLHLTSPWASESSRGQAGRGQSGSATVDAWASRLTTDTQRFLDHLETTFAQRRPESISQDELDLAAMEFEVDSLGPASEQLFGGILNKVKNVVGAVAKTGVNLLTKITGLSAITGILRKLVDPLVRRIVTFALHKLPPAAQGPARALALKLGVQESSSAQSIVTEFDRQFAEALTAGNEAAADQLLTAAGEAAALDGEDPVSELDTARARLVDELSTAPPGEPPVVQVEQFIPAVMAAMPLIRTAVKIMGRDRIKGLLARPLALFITPLIGAQAARTLAPQLADTGMKLLKLEHELPATLGAEALVATLEETVRQVFSLPAEALADDLRLGVEVQEAFAEAAARYLPRQVLRTDLETGDPEDERGSWIMMPRTAAPHFRYRAYSRPFPILLPRPTAATIVIGEEETLEERMMDAGVSSWPVEAEVRLYEAVPGTHLGHLAATENDPASTETLATDEFAELTPEVAGLLLGAPGLGRAAGPGATIGRTGVPRPGQRFFRVLARGTHPRTGRRIRRLALRLDLSNGTPVLRVHLRIGERAAHTIATQLDQRAQLQVVATLRRLLGPAARLALAQRLSRLRTLNTPDPLPEERRRALAETLAEAMLTTAAKELPSAAAALAGAARDPAAGITLTFAFPYPDRAALTGDPGAPTLSIRPGLHRD